jgi:hypothetical protein
MNDLIASGLSLAVVGASYWGSGERFDLLLFEVGWFGFTLLSFRPTELPLFVWYARRYRVLERAG